LTAHYRLLDLNDTVALIGTKPGYLLRKSIEQVARSFRGVTGEPFFECFRCVEIAHLAGYEFSRASIQMPNQRPVARIQEGSAKPAPFTGCSEHAARVALCLLEHILGVH